jgi:hypothetical protein
VALTILSVATLIRDEGPPSWAKYKILRYLPDWNWQTWLVLVVIVLFVAVFEGAYRLYQQEQERGHRKPLFDAFNIIQSSIKMYQAYHQLQLWSRP